MAYENVVHMTIDEVKSAIEADMRDEERLLNALWMALHNIREKKKTKAWTIRSVKALGRPRTMIEDQYAAYLEENVERTKLAMELGREGARTVRAQKLRSEVWLMELDENKPVNEVQASIARNHQDRVENPYRYV